MGTEVSSILNFRLSGGTEFLSKAELLSKNPKFLGAQNPRLKEHLFVTKSVSLGYVSLV